MLSHVRKLLGRLDPPEGESETPLTLFVLKQLAERATPGRWKYDTGTVITAPGLGFSSISAQYYDEKGHDADRDGEFMAACSPGVICELVARLLCLELCLDQISVLVEDPDVRQHIEHFKSMYGSKVALGTWSP